MIRLQDVTYRYPNATRSALSGFSLELHDGEFCAILGANGAGKTTACLAVSGLVPFFYGGLLTGSVELNGANYGSLGLTRILSEVGLVLEDPSSQLTGACFSVKDEIAFGLENYGVSPQEASRRTTLVTDALMIGGLLDRNPLFLSGGEQQLVAMASILALQTPVLVLDEATGQLDDGRAMGLYKLLRSLADDGRTVLVTDNRYEMIAEYCDRVIVADGGHVVSAGAPRDIFPLLEVVGLVGTTRFIQAVRHLEQHSLWSSTWGYPATLEGAVERCRLVSSSTFKG